MKYIVIVADTNDGDYVTSMTPIQDEEVDKVLHIIQAIDNFKPYKSVQDGMEWKHRHNFPTGEIIREDQGEKSPKELYVDTGFCTEDELDLFEEQYVPFGQYEIHTIKTIEIWDVKEIKTLLGKER